MVAGCLSFYAQDFGTPIFVYGEPSQELTNDIQTVDNQESAQASDNQESAQASDNQESAQAPDNQESAQAPDNQESAQAPDNQESAQAPDNQESAQAPDNQESAQAPDNQESAQAPDNQESAQASGETETVTEDVYITPENLSNKVTDTVYNLPTLDQLLDLQPIPELGEEVVMNIVYGTLEGWVTDFNGFPLEQVTVTLTTADAVYIARTDTKGFYSITAPKSSYELTFRLYGYGTEKFGISLFEDNYQDCTLGQLVPVEVSLKGHHGKKSLRIVKAKVNKSPNFTYPDYEILPLDENYYGTLLLPIGRYYAKISNGSKPKEFWVGQGKNVLQL